LIIFIFRYREKKNPKAATQMHGNNTLEVIWTLIPLLLVMAMFYYGWVGWKPIESNPPEDAMHIKTVARMWKWNFQYDNGRRMDTLVIPVGKPVALNMESPDVIHSLYIPAFRLKKDVVPGKPRTAWFIANSPGTYDLFCTEYCGLQHSSMITLVKALPSDEFDAWYKANETETVETVKEKPAPASAGKRVVQQLGCNACHSVDGTTLVGPSYKGLFGKEETVITDGKERTVTVDEEYIRHSIYDPNADIVKGFNKGLMLSYEGQVSDEEMELIIEYIKSLQ
jgi:cytochrome c oxidase subunit 2